MAKPKATVLEVTGSPSEEKEGRIYARFEVTGEDEKFDQSLMYQDEGEFTSLAFVLEKAKSLARIYTTVKTLYVNIEL